jgi:hypothetical protein
MFCRQPDIRLERPDGTVIVAFYEGPAWTVNKIDFDAGTLETAIINCNRFDAELVRGAILADQLVFK